MPDALLHTDTRLNALRRAMSDAGLDHLLVTSRENVRYLSGFTGSSGWLLIGVDSRVLLTDFRYREQAAQESPQWSTEIVSAGLHGVVRDVIAQDSVRRIGYESAHLSVRDFEQLTASDDADTPVDSTHTNTTEWVSTHGLVEHGMTFKDAAEIETIARAAELTDRLFSELINFVHIGVTEREIAAEAEYRARKLGGDGLAFPPIVASGPRAALPHATPTDRAIQPGDMITFDLGVCYDGYASDMTRTVAVQYVTDKLRKVYDLVLRAQVAALDAVRPGMNCAELDGIARQIIADAGHAEHFGHSLGHGVGLRVHEAPALSWRATESVLEPEMIVTIEPGVYLPGWGGVRIEDLVVVTETGRRVLSQSTKDLLIVGKN